MVCNLHFPTGMTSGFRILNRRTLQKRKPYQFLIMAPNPRHPAHPDTGTQTQGPRHRDPDTGTQTSSQAKSSTPYSFGLWGPSRTQGPTTSRTPRHRDPDFMTSKEFYTILVRPLGAVTDTGTHDIPHTQTQGPRLHDKQGVLHHTRSALGGRHGHRDPDFMTSKEFYTILVRP